MDSTLTRFNKYTAAIRDVLSSPGAHGCDDLAAAVASFADELVTAVEVDEAEQTPAPAETAAEVPPETADA